MFREKCLQVVPEEHNREVTRFSAFADPEPLKKIQHWDKATKRYIEFERPYIMGAYNRLMGGEDLLDSFAAKIALLVYLHLLEHHQLSHGQCLVQYKPDHKVMNLPKKEILNRRPFQAQLAFSLILVTTAVIKPKRGQTLSTHGRPVCLTGSPMNARKRPSTDNGSPSNGILAKRATLYPTTEIHKDMHGHFPVKTNRRCCRYCDKGYTNTL